MTKDKSLIQSCIDHINTAVDVDPWAKELVAEMGKEILKAQLSCEGTTSDCISRQAVRFIETNSDSYPEEWNDDYEKGFTDALNKVIALPSVQPYTDEQIQRMQNMEQAQLDKAFELGQEDAKPIVKPERKKDIVQKFHDYQVDWLKSHYDIELEQQLEEMIIRFLHDTANRYIMEEGGQE